MEISDSCGHLKIPHAVEIDKAHSWDFMQVGRVRFQLKKSDGSFWNPAISSKKALMLQIAELVPKHHGRIRSKRQRAVHQLQGQQGQGLQNLENMERRRNSCRFLFYNMMFSVNDLF